MDVFEVLSREVSIACQNAKTLDELCSLINAAFVRNRVGALGLNPPGGPQVRGRNEPPIEDPDAHDPDTDPYIWNEEDHADHEGD